VCVSVCLIVSRACEKDSVCVSVRSACERDYMSVVVEIICVCQCVSDCESCGGEGLYLCIS